MNNLRCPIAEAIKERMMKTKKFFLKIPKEEPISRVRLRDLYRFFEKAPVGTVIRTGKRGKIVAHKYLRDGSVEWWISKNGKPRYL